MVVSKLHITAKRYVTKRSVCLFVCLSVCLSVNMFVTVAYVYMSPVCLSVCLSVYLSSYLYTMILSMLQLDATVMQVQCRYKVVRYYLLTCHYI